MVKNYLYILFTLKWVLLVGVMLFSTATYAGDKVRILIRAFIPSDIEGSTDLLPVPGNPKRIMLSAPLTCFESDNRGFSDNPSASSRITTDFTIEVTDPPVITPTIKSDRFIAGVTRKLDCDSGAEVLADRADVAGCTMGSAARTSKEVQIITACSVSNPLFLLAPSIDYGGSFIYDLRKFTLSFEGYIGRFPSFEIYGSLNGGKFVQILARNPNNGEGPFKLMDLWLHMNTIHVVVPPTKLYFK